MDPAKEKQVERGPVALVKIREHAAAAVAEALDLAQGFKHLAPGSRVLVKPNLVGLPSKVPAPPFGVVTSTLVLEGLLKALKDAGAGPITVGDGGLVNDDAGLDTTYTMEALGYPALAKRYGFTMVDFNRSAHREVQRHGLKIKIAEAALDQDFVISLPTLKTHSQTRVSLSLKNMKGCLHKRSKAACHDESGGLSHNVAILSRMLYPDLALIDGRYSLALGPAHTGKAVRSDLLIAARDALDADLAGAAVLGAEIGQIVHLQELARAMGRDTEVPAVVGGVPIEDVCLNLEWDWPWLDPYTPAVFKKFNAKGLLLPKYDHTLCTGCSFIYNPLMVMGTAAAAAADAGGVEVLSGKAMGPSGLAHTTVLLGNCMIKKRKGDPGIKKEVLIKGCPPTMADLEKGLQEAGLKASLNAYQFFTSQMGKHYTEEGGYLTADFKPGERA